MKHIFALILLLSTFFSARGQETLQIDTTAPPGYVTLDYAFQQFNTAQVTSGLLLDRALPLTKMTRYNGQLSDSNRVSALSFGLAYAQLSGAALNSAAQLPDPTTSLGSYASNEDTIPIKMMYFHYDQIKSTALANGDISVQNNQLINVPGRIPFELDTAFLASPWTDATLEGDTFSFVIQAPFTNDSAAIQNISVDFGDGQGWRTVTIGQVLQVGYAQSDTVIFRYRLTLNGGMILESHSRMVISIPPQDRGYGSHFDISGIGGATVTGLSNCGDETICKPLIVVEGFNAPAFGDLFNSTFTTFRGIIKSFDATPSGKSLLAEFETAGYDLVYIDFNDGTASLESNAEVVKAVIRKVNELKAESGCSERNVVFGESMGGVLAKLALREMEEAGEDHQCSKLFTHDSPLRGANIPLGYQIMLSHVANLEISGSSPLKAFVGILEDAETTLNAPGPRQMLIYHLDNFPGPNTDYIQFYQKLRNLGALQNCEHIAISNGSQISSGQGFGANDRLLKIKGDGSDFLEDCVGLSGFLANLAEVVTSALLGTTLAFDFEVRALPSPTQGNKFIYASLINAKLLGISIIVDVRGAIVGGTQPLDNASGGYIEIPTDDLAPCLSQIVTFDHTHFCFVPTVSSIEVGPYVGTSELSDVNTDVSNNAAILASGLTTVDRFVAFNDPVPSGAPPTSLNQGHISFSSDNTGTMLYELLSVASPSGVLNNRTYNYGTSSIEAYNYSNPPNPIPLKQTSNVIAGNLTIEGSGKVWINRNDRMAFTDDPGNPQVANPSSFQVFLSGEACNDDPTTVTVKSGGEISVGEWSSAANNVGMLNVGQRATLNIDRNGTVDVNDNARLFIENGGVTNVLNGGMLHVNWWEGKIRVRNGGVLRIHSGATLRVSNGAAVEVEAGGRLIIEPQAIVQLWGGGAQDGESRIHIQSGGELVINGTFDFSHNGYFRFDNGHLLTLGGGVFKLKGAGKQVRFIQLNNTHLVVTGNQLLDFKDGEIQYNGDASITAQEGGRIIFNNLTCVGQGKALYLQNPNLVSLNHVDILEGFNPAIEAWDVRSNIPFNVSNCNIEVGTTNGVEAYNSQLLKFANTNLIEPHPTDNTTGFELLNVQMLSLSNCNISNMLTGINATDSRVVLLRGGEISDCFYGIKDDFTQTIGGTPVNVMMFEGATIRNSSDKAIYILGSKSSGSVLMDCAKLIDNANGIVGEDITLMIDAEEHRQCIADPVSPNTFKKQANQGPFFTICYRQKDVGQVEAKGNYWFPHTLGDWRPVPGSWSITKMHPNGNGPCTNFVGFNSNMATQHEPAFCVFPTNPCQEDPPAPMASCEVELEEEPFIVNEAFHSGINFIKNEQLEMGENLLTPVSELKGNAEVLEVVCKNFVNMAYAIVETNPVPRSPVRWREDAKISTFERSVILSPNPAANFVQLICPGQFTVSVVDGLGRIYVDQTAENLTIIDTKNWPEGVYFAKIKSLDQATLVQKVLIVQR